MSPAKEYTAPFRDVFRLMKSWLTSSVEIYFSWLLHNFKSFDVNIQLLLGNFQYTRVQKKVKTFSFPMKKLDIA